MEKKIWSMEKVSSFAILVTIIGALWTLVLAIVLAISGEKNPEATHMAIGLLFTGGISLAVAEVVIRIRRRKPLYPVKGGKRTRPHN